MATTNPHASPQDLERAAVYNPIPGGPQAAQQRPLKKFFPAVLFTLFVFLSLILFIIKIDDTDEPRSKLTNGVSPLSPAVPLIDRPSRGVAQGVSEKVFREAAAGNLSFSWTNAMLSWQRTAFHFQPEKNWMNGNHSGFLARSRGAEAPDGSVQSGLSGAC